MTSNIVKLSGDINFSSVVSLRKLGEQRIANNSTLCFDFSEIKHHDSSILALLIAWQRAAKHCKAQVEFANLPASFYALSALCNFAPLNLPTLTKVVAA